MGRLEKIKQLRDTAADSPALQSLRSTDAARIAGEVVSAAAKEAKLTNPSGDLTKLRVARAAARPSSTARSLLKGAAKEGVRQALKSRDADGADESGLGNTD